VVVLVRAECGLIATVPGGRLESEPRTCSPCACSWAWSRTVLDWTQRPDAWRTSTAKVSSAERGDGAAAGLIAPRQRLTPTLPLAGLSSPATSAGHRPVPHEHRIPCLEHAARLLSSYAVTVRLNGQVIRSIRDTRATSRGSLAVQLPTAQQESFSGEFTW